MQLEEMKGQKVKVNGKSLKTLKREQATQEIKRFLCKYQIKHEGT